MRESTVAASIIIDLVNQIVQSGTTVPELCRRARLDPALLGRPHDRVPGSVCERLWQVAVEVSADPLIGLHVAEHYRPGALNIFGYVILNCRTGLEAVDRLGRFAGLLNDGLRVRTTCEGPHSVIALEPIEGLDNFLLRDGRQVMETMSAGIALTLRRLLGRHIAPSQVWFRHHAGGPVEEYHRIFGVPVRFGREEDRLAFSTGALQAPIDGADPSLLALFEEHARERLAEIELRDGIRGRVARLLATKLVGATPPLAAVAREMAMSGRNLQRVLREEGTTYQALLDTVRREVARTELRKPGATAAEVALLLGFSEASAFTRAFRRWTGVTPGAYASGERSARATQ